MGDGHCDEVIVTVSFLRRFVTQKIIQETLLSELQRQLCFFYVFGVDFLVPV